jgi:hypothetical protein
MRPNSFFRKGRRVMSQDFVPYCRVRRICAAAGVLIALIVLALPLVVFASSATSKPEILVVPWKYTFQEHLAAPPKVSSGDTLQATFTFTGSRPGTADFACTAVGDRFLCQGVLRFADGDIYAGCCPVDETQTAAIVGGTRAFVGVTGQFSQRFITADTGFWTLELHRLQRRDDYGQ